jgi:hypothetical protein
LLVAAAVLPTVFLVVTTAEPLRAGFGGSTAAGSVPLLVTGVLYLVASRFERTSTPGQPPPEPPSRPQPAVRG